MRRFAIIPALEESPRWVERVRTSRGQLLVLLVFLALLALRVRGGLWLGTAAALALVTAFPAARRTILAFTALYWALVHVPFRWNVLATIRSRVAADVELDFRIFSVTAIAAVLCFCALGHEALRRQPTHALARHPVASLLGFYGALLAAASLAPVRGPAALWTWAFLVVLGHYLWFFAYALLDARRAPERRFVGHLAFFHPFWGSTHTPLPKGAAYLDQVEARDPTALAISQLKGLKLLAWSLLLTLVGILTAAVCYGAPLPYGLRAPVQLLVPPLGAAFRASVAGQALPWYQNWAAMLLGLGLDGIRLAIWGHQFVAIARMAGFNARRNTYKPFFATSVSEFFNRYYYYFKELLVDCFFYPVFYALPRRRLKLALLVATLAAAGFGNFLYHLLRDLEVVADRGLLQTLVDSHVHALYCLLLALGIFVSQLRRLRAKGRERSAVARIRSVVLVWLFFALLSTFYVDLRNTVLTDHLRFFADCIPGVPG